MREIKFRAWYEKEKKFIENVSLRGGKYYRCISEGFALQYDPSYVALEVEQYTGLKDKNGKEIYEGDIIHSIYPDNNIVFFNEEYASFGYRYKSDFGNSYIELYHHLMDIEVIGNIHENPELLEVK